MEDLRQPGEGLFLLRLAGEAVVDQGVAQYPEKQHGKPGQRWEENTSRDGHSASLSTLEGVEVGFGRVFTARFTASVASGFLRGGASLPGMAALRRFEGQTARSWSAH